MERNAPPPYAELPLPELLRQLSTDTATLVRQEVQLARAELAQKSKLVTASAAGFGAAAAFGIGAFGALTATLIALLAVWLPVWAAALIVTVLYALGAIAGVQAGRKALANFGEPVPQTVESVKEDVEAVRAGVRRAR